MAVFPTVDGIASALSFILAAVASLRAASRLEHRICNDGSIGLMCGPPILGPATQRQRQRTIDGGEGAQSPLDDSDTIREEGAIIDDENRTEASPLWEHTEAFRRAVILGLVFDSNTETGGAASSVFSDITRTDGKPMAVRGGSENDVSIAAAVEAGLLLPSSRVRGGGVYAKSVQRAKGKEGGNSSSNPVGMISDWFIRELSAPLAAIPAWHGLLCSYFREKKESKLRKSQWCLLTPWERLRYLLTGSSSGKGYDPTRMDFGASISGTAHIPCGDIVDSPSTTKAVRVKAFAPKAFRNLRNKCFRVSEREYARSILNLMDYAVSTSGTEENVASAHLQVSDDSISRMLQEIVGKRRQRGRIRQSAGPMPYISFQSNSKGAARAGTFFFFTADGAYMVKTVKREEARAFLEMLPEYHRFMSEGVNSRNSLLTRIFGMYSVQFASEADDQSSVDTGDRWDGGLFSPSLDRTQKIADDERVYLVMHSVFPSEASAFITERFDLKGSTVGRECSLEERQSKGANAVLKDLDLKREVAEEQNTSEDDSSGINRVKNARYGLSIGRRRKTALMAQLERDVDLLHRCNVLDYSLLVGVADMDPKGGINVKADSKRVPRSLQNLFHWMDFPMPYYGAGTTEVDGGALSALSGTRKGKRVMYYMGVIDFLQPWTVKKRLERDLKGLAGYDMSAISCVAPSDYACRFLEFVTAHVT